MARADHSLRFGAAGTEAANGFTAGESGQRKGNAADQSGQHGVEGGPGRERTGLPGNAEWGSAMCGRG